MGIAAITTFGHYCAKNIKKGILIIGEKLKLIIPRPNGIATTNSMPSTPLTQLQTGIRPAIGVSRFDNWAHNSINTVVYLNESKYRWRTPFYSKEVTEPVIVSYDGKNYPITLTTNADDMVVENKMIDYAFLGGVDYFAFVYYMDNEGLEYGRKNYRLSSNPHKNKVKFCYILEFSNNPNDALTNRLWHFFDNNITQLGEDGYFKVLNGRPLIYLLENGFEYKNNSGMPKASLIAAMNAKYIVSFPNKPLPYYVPMGVGNDQDYTKVAKRMPTRGNSTSSYAGNTIFGGNHNYVQSQNSFANELQNMVNRGIKVIPTVGTGFDNRVILKYPELSPGYPIRPQLYVETATDLEFKIQVQKSIDFVRANPIACEANTILIYAWSEHTEGGFICPTLIPNSGGQINTGKITALSQVI